MNRQEVIAAMGGACARCPEMDHRVLQFDHVAGDGAAHRRIASPSVILRDVAASVAANDGRYQLLCANCNWRKRLDNKEGGKPGRPAGSKQTAEAKAAITVSVKASWTRPSTRARRTAGVHKAWAEKTPEELAAHAEKVSAGKIAAGNQGNVENLTKGWTPEVHARAVQASADARRGVAETEEHRSAISAGVKKAYAEGRRVAGHSDETKRKISAAKKGCGPTVSEVWAKHDGACSRCGTSERPHKSGGRCGRCYARRQDN